jgi:hypothetical protein
MNFFEALADINWPVATVLIVAMIVLAFLVWAKVIPVEVISHGLSVLAGVFVGGTSSLVRNYHTGNTMRPPPYTPPYKPSSSIKP